MTSATLFLAWVLADPPPGDAYRIPPIPVLRDACDFNRRYRDHLEHRLEWEARHRGELYAAMREAESLYKVYDDAWGARPDFPCSDAAKVQYLRDFRLAVGRDAYYRMEMPPPVPYHRFNELR
ncbi:MAG TPA: hypothetical protein VFG68_12815 [Fimbriiglobus sp.]|nr:hypothetical protein [Fimbriiglobus sp.]